MEVPMRRFLIMSHLCLISRRGSRWSTMHVTDT
jgi:hypothetical protein